MQQLNHLVKHISPELYQSMLTAVETGKWPNGQLLSTSQREYAQQWIMMWQAHHNKTPHLMTISKEGNIVDKISDEKNIALFNKLD